MCFIPLWLQAKFWEFVAESALLIRAMLGYFVKIPQCTIAAVMAFGAGVLVLALAFELINEAYTRGGFVSGAILYLSREQSSDRASSKLLKMMLVVVVCVLLDSIPESIVIGYL